MMGNTLRGDWSRQGYGNGRMHAIPCPAPAHPGDRNSRSCKVQLRGEEWMLKCWSHGCAYADIAAGLGLELRTLVGRPRSRVQHLVASYEHPDGKPRDVFRWDFPADFPNQPTCLWKDKSAVCGQRRRHKHIVAPLSSAGSHLLLWGADAPKNALVLVEGEKAAAALAAADVNAAGYTPASWRGGAKTVGRVDFERARGRAVVLWPDNHDEGQAAMDLAATRCVGVGVSSLHLVDVAAATLGLPAKGDAADLPPDARLAALPVAQAYVAAPPAVAPPPPLAPPVAAAPEWLRPDMQRLMEDSPDVQNPYADAVRYLRQHGAATLVISDVEGRGAHGQGKGSAVMGLDPLTGLWDGLEPVRNAICNQAAEAFEAVKAQVSPGMPWPRQSLTYFGKVVRSLPRWDAAADIIPYASAGFPVVHCRARDIDKPGGYLGCENGVVDLQTGRLLPPDEGKLHAVSRSTGVAYKPRAKHPYVDALFARLDAATAAFLKAILGQGLWGQPDDLTLVLTGPTRGGKTTLLEAIRAAVGHGYYGTASADVASRGGRYSGGSHTEDRRAIYTMRYCGIVEAENTKADGGKLKAMTGGDSAPFRGIHQEQETLSPTALIIWAANAMPTLGMEDPAVLERVRIVDWPQIPAEERLPDIKAAFRAVETGPAEAMLALLVANARDNPPYIPIAVPASVEAAQQREIEAAQSAFGGWLNAGVVGARDHRLAVATLWAEWARFKGEDPAQDEIGGIERTQFPKKVRSLYRAVGLGPVVHLRVRGQVVKGWHGIRLADAAHTPEMAMQNGHCPACGDALMYDDPRAEWVCPQLCPTEAK